MAKTYPKRGLKVLDRQNTHLSMATRRLPLTTGQTIPEGAPMKIASGLLLEWVSIADALMYAIAVEEKTSSAAGDRVECVLSVPQLELEGSFLGSSAADNVLAAGDFGTGRLLIKNANLLGTGKAGWFIQDGTGAAEAVRLVDDTTNEVVPNAAGPTRAVAGDTNARVRAKLKLEATVHR